MRCRLKASEVNHLRRLLAWMRCEYMLDDYMQKGYAQAAKWMVEVEHCTEAEARKLLEDKAAEIHRVPKYVRDAVKMLDCLVREDEGEVIDHVATRKARRIVHRHGALSNRALIERKP